MGAINMLDLVSESVSKFFGLPWQGVYGDPMFILKQKIIGGKVNPIGY